jgi:hypothetical protein
MGNSCGCSHCHHDEEQDGKTPEEKIEDLKKAIEELGYKIEETPEGDIKISE